MRHIKILLLVSFGATIAMAQSLPHFDHIIIVFQENRTPDNLFGSAPTIVHCGTQNPFEAGVDIQDGGLYQGATICLTARHMNDTFDPGHGHSDFVNQWHNGQMDGAPLQAYAFVPRGDVEPYFQIAEDYGFANYMFQTNEGPSYAAHQFIISGTSAPTANLNGHYNWFDAGNANNPSLAGCTAPAGEFTLLIDNNGVEPSVQYCTDHPLDAHCAYTCFDHPTLVDLLDSVTPKIPWKYYLPAIPGIWAAPTTIQRLCQPGPAPGACQGTEYNADMIFETAQHTMPIVDDINSCNLAAVNWVIPDKKWSDHAQENDGSGPSYVATIVNAIGGVYNNNQCNYWRNDPNHSVAIFVTWDDWGGWFDHVNPNGGNPPYPGVNRVSGTWGAFYTYGFRVPLLVVSPYTKAGYVSGSIPDHGKVFPYVHDFGSILRFIELNFGISDTINQQYQFADFHAPDNANGNVPLSEFFLWPYRSFTQITSLPYSPSYFQTQGTLDGPDANDSD